MNPLTDEQNPCPVCGSTETKVSEFSGETVCLGCGCVLQDLVIGEHGGLSYLSMRAQGDYVLPQEPIQMGSIIPQEFSRARRYSYTGMEQNLLTAMSELKTITSQLRLSHDIVVRAAQIYRQVLHSPNLRKQKIIPMVSAAIYAAHRTEGMFIFEMDIANVANISVKALHQYTRKIHDALGLQFKREEPSGIIFFFYNNYEREIDPTTKNYTYRILDELEKKHHHLFSSSKIRGIATGCIYLALKRTYDDTTLETVSRVLRINYKTTHRNVSSYREAIGEKRLEELYQVSVKLGL